MGESFVQVFIESCERLMAKDLEVVEIGLSGVVVMLVTILVKFFVWLASRGSKSSTVQGQPVTLSDCSVYILTQMDMGVKKR